MKLDAIEKGLLRILIFAVLLSCFAIYKINANCERKEQYINQCRAQGGIVLESRSILQCINVKTEACHEEK